MTEPSASTDFVLRNLRWVRQLARALVRDPGHADDLVQDAWLRVHRSPPPPGRRDRAWLARVLRNLARDSRRADSRRTRRELDSARPDRASTDEHLGDLASRYETLVQWLRELDEPYRRTLLLRWMEGQTPERIATEASVPIATVRTRLRRGEALLRERAERESHGRGQAWLAGLAVAPEGLLSPGRVLLTTMALMKLKIAAALALVTLAGWLALRSWDSPAWVRVEVPSALEFDDELAGLDDSPDVGGRLSSRSSAAAPLEEPVGTTPGPDAPEPTQNLIVQVLDDLGQPVVHAPVAIYMRRGDDNRGKIRATTESPSGEACFEQIGATLARRSAQNPGVLFSVGLDCPGWKMERVPLDRNALPTEPVVLVPPAHGRLEVHILHPDGSPFPLEDWVYITPLFSDPARPWHTKRGDRVEFHLEGEHIAVLPVVQAGIPLRIRLYDQGLLQGVDRDIEPLAPHETRVVEIELGKTLPHALGRLVDVTGAPIHARMFDVEFEPDGNARVDHVEEDGSFALPLGRLRGTDDVFTATIAVHFLTSTTDPSQANHHLTGTFTARKPLDGGSVNVGAIVMHSAPALVSGHVVDAEGAPVEGAYISIYKKANRRDDPEVFDWHFAGLDYVYTDASGAFSVLSDLEADEYALRAHGEGWADRGAIRFPSGARGIEVVVDRSHFIVGRVLLPDGADSRGFTIHAVVPDASREQRTYARWETGIESDGAFELQDLRPGPVTLQLISIGQSEPIVSLAGVIPTMEVDELTEGVDPWDLSEDLLALSFTVFRGDGSPSRRSMVGLASGAVETLESRFTALVNTSVDDKVLVVAPGHIPARFSARSMPDQVHLEWGRAIRIQLEEPIPELPEGWAVEVGLSRQGRMELPTEGRFSARPMLDWSLAGRLNERAPVHPGEAGWTLHAPTAGNYNPEWRIWIPSEDKDRRSPSVHSIREEPDAHGFSVENVRGPAIRYAARLDLAEVSELIEKFR